MAQPRQVTGREPVSLILTGPTGIGKTALAVELAHRHPYELISADSMQVYRGMEIGTAQPTKEELLGVPSHGCGMIAPDEPFSAQRFVEFCSEAHARIVAAGKIPLYVGGTGMYLRALRWGLFSEDDEAPKSTSPEERQCRRALTEELNQIGLEAMYARLVAVDPDYAAKIGPRDKVRIIRALEVHQLTRRTMTEIQSQWKEPKARFPHRLIVLKCPREALVRRIESRVDSMLASGWIAEVRKLLDSGYGPDLHSFKSLGYREIARHLNGEMTLEELCTRIKAVTRQFAKRQMTWFRREKDVSWLDYDGVLLTPVASKIEKMLEMQPKAN